MKITQIALTVLLSTAAVSAFPGSTLDARANSDDSCYIVHYAQDKNGKKYGGAYDSCTKTFDQSYSEPVYSASDPCWVTAYQKDKCGNLYGGAYNSCHGSFKKYYKTPKCQKNGKPTSVSQSNVCGNNINVYCCNSDGSGAISSNTCSAASGSSICSVTIVCCNANTSIQTCTGSVTVTN